MIIAERVQNNVDMLGLKIVVVPRDLGSGAFVGFPQDAAAGGGVGPAMRAALDMVDTRSTKVKGGDGPAGSALADGSN
eukprot:3497319-Pyramimonas_sp.AAC.1